MIRIGIISPFHKENIRKYLKNVLHECTTVSKSADSDTLLALELSGVSFCAIDLEKNSCFVDILILDTEDDTLINKSLRAMFPDTRLIYNSDKCPEINHPHAISYGFANRATATVSSVAENSFLMYLHSLQRLDNTLTDEGEYMVYCDAENITDALCAITCAVLCGSSENDFANLRFRADTAFPYVGFKYHNHY